MDPFDLVGDVLDGQFRVEEFVGEGALSVVYRASAETLGAPVAIKCLNLPTTLDDAFQKSIISSFVEGCKLHYRLARGHLAIAQTFGSGTTVAPRTGAQVPYIVREWYDGESLARDLRRRRAEGEAGRDLKEVIALFAPVAEALAFAHKQDAPHLSLMPSNLFLAEQGDEIALKLLDFGVGRVVDEVASTRTGKPAPAAARIQLLLPTYAAPEQLLGTLGPTGPWTDVYAFALVLLEVLSDRAVMGAKDASAIVARTLNPKTRPTPREHGLDLPPALDAVLTRALALEPESRQANLEDMWSDIVAASKPPWPEQRRLATMLRRIRRSRRVDVRRGRSIPPPAFNEEEAPTTKARGVVSMLTARVRSSTRPPPAKPNARKPPALPHVPLPPKLPHVTPNPSPTPSPSPSPSPNLSPSPQPSPSPSPALSLTPSLSPSLSLTPAPSPTSVPPPPAYLTDLLAPFEASAGPIPSATTEPPAIIISDLPPLPPPLPPPEVASIIDSSTRVEPHEIPVLQNPFAPPRPSIDRRIVLGAIAGGLVMFALVIVVIASITHSRAHAALAAPSITASIASSPAQIPEPPPPIASSSPIATTATPIATAAPTTTESAPIAPKKPGRFNRRAAVTAISGSTADLTDCRHRGGVWGIGQAGVIFANDGSVRQVLMSPPFKGVEGACVTEHIKTARIDPFVGIIGPIYARFVIPY